MDHIRPEDSMSQVTNVSTTSSARARAAAKKASLEARRKMMNMQQQLERRKLELDLEAEMMRLDIDIQAALAEEKALRDAEESAKDEKSTYGFGHSEIETPRNLMSTKLNSGAPPFSPDHTDKMASSYDDPGRRSGPGGQSYDDSARSRGPSWYGESREYGATGGQSLTDSTDMRRLIDAMSLPKSHLMKFDGDPMMYWTFMNSFDSSICIKVESTVRVLYWTSSESRQVVRSDAPRRRISSGERTAS